MKQIYLLLVAIALLLPLSSSAKKNDVNKVSATLAHINVKFAGSEAVMTTSSPLSLNQYIEKHKEYSLNEWMVTNVVLRAFISNNSKKQVIPKKELKSGYDEIDRDNRAKSNHSKQILNLMSGDKMVSSTSSNVPGGYRNNIYMSVQNQTGVNNKSWSLQLKKGGPLYVRNLKITIQKSN